MVWDLRTTRATIISFALFDIFEHQRNHDFAKWFNAIKETYSWARHQISEKKGEENFEDREKKAVEMFNKHRTTFTTGQGTSQEISEVIQVLECLQEYLFDKMNEAGMFGSKYYEEA